MDWETVSGLQAQLKCMHALRKEAFIHFVVAVLFGGIGAAFFMLDMKTGAYVVWVAGFLTFIRAIAFVFIAGHDIPIIKRNIQSSLDLMRRIKNNGG